jgi:ABC-type multidrug transport system fused ATPase/permease subunit
MQAEPTPTLFSDTVKPFRGRIALTYSLALFENVFELLYPFTIGLAINGLISNQGWISVLPFVGIWTLHIISATGRQMYDTRLFAKIYASVAQAMILRQQEAGVSTSEIAARSVMTREAIDFFEFEIPELLTALITLLGGVGMLYFYDFGSGLAMSVLLVPIALLYIRFGRKSLRLSERLNNRHENEVSAIIDGRKPRVAHHFKALKYWRLLIF